MWTVLIFVNLWGLYCSVSTSPPSPIDVSFSSVNLRNVLQWFPGNGTPDDMHFTVEYAIYGDSIEGVKGRKVHWRAVRQCTAIVRTWCDLSNETWDVEHGYYARVRAVGGRASSKWALTRRRFYPKSDTIFGPPLVSVEVENNSAIITVKGPMRYLPNNHTSVLSMAVIYPHMTYNLSIHNTHRNQMHHFPVVTSPYKYHLMEYNTEYCFSARSKFLSMPVRCQSSAWHCITTPQDPVIEQLKRVVVGIVVPSLCICMIMVAGYLLYHYLKGKGQKSPYILNPPTFHPPPVMFPLEKLNHIQISVIKDEPPSNPNGAISDPACPKRQQRTTGPPPSYSLQRPEAPPGPEEPWDYLSTDYGFVDVAPDINVAGEEEARERRHGEGHGGKGACQKCAARGSYQKKEGRAEGGHSAGGYLLQQSAHTCRQTHVPIRAQTEMSTLVEAQAWSQMNPVLRTQTQAPLQFFQGSTMGEVNGRNPQTGFFHVPLNLQMKREEGRGEGMDGKIRADREGNIDGGVEEEKEPENVPLLSAYASQNIQYIPVSQSDQSDFLPDDYGVLRPAETEEREEDGYDDEEEERTICINWDPETRKLPEISMASNAEGGTDGLTLSDRGREDGIGGEDEEAYMTKGELRLENVFVRQGSEEEAEAQKELEEGGWEVDNILTKWKLVISMDE